MDNQKENQNQKYSFLSPMAVFKFDFTFTALKWAALLASLLSCHQYYKTKDFKKAYSFFMWGFVGTGLPIWGVLFGKFNIYSMSLRKYDKQQRQVMKQLDVTRKFLRFRVNIDQGKQVSDEELLRLNDQLNQRELRKKMILEEYLVHKPEQLGFKKA